MNQPIIYRYCLLILSHETNIIAENSTNHNNTHNTTNHHNNNHNNTHNHNQVGARNDEELPILIQSFSEAFKTTAVKDQVSVMKHIFTALFRVLSRASSPNECKIIHGRHVFAAVECLDTMTAFLSQNSNATALLISELPYVVEPLKKMLYLLTAIMEAVKASQSPSSVGTAADYEETAMRVTSAVSNIVCYFQSCKLARGLLPSEDGRQWDYVEGKAPEAAVNSSNTELCHDVDNPPVSEVLLKSLDNSLRGPLLAQLISGLLFFANHLNKSLSVSALQCLLCVLRFVSNITDWRMFVPGIFTALFGICTSGYKSGSNVLCLALVAMIETVLRVTDDNHPDHIQYRLKPNVFSSVFNENAGLANATIDELFKGFQAKAGIEQTAAGTSTQNGNKTSDIEVLVPKRSSSGQLAKDRETASIALVQWRVDFLQRIGSALPVAFKDVYSQCNPRQRLRVTYGLHRLLIASRGFLGNSVFLDYLFLIFPAADDLTGVVRVYSRKLLSNLANKERDCDQWVRVHADIAERWFKAIVTAGRLIDASCGGSVMTGVILPSVSSHFGVSGGSDNTLSLTSAMTVRSHGSADTFSNIDAKLLNSLSTAIGCGILLRSDLDLSMIAYRDDLIRCMQVFFIPDIEVANKSMAFVTRRYYFSKSAGLLVTSDSNLFVDAGYYKIPLLGTRNDDCLSACRRLVGLIGMKVALANIVHATKDAWVRVVSCCCQPYRRRPEATVEIDQSAEVSTIRIKEIRSHIALWLLQSAIIVADFDLGECPSRSYPSPDPSIDVAQRVPNSKCGYCGVITKHMSRCSRCKIMYYCSSEHQRKHWATHKKSCSHVEATEPTPVLSAQTQSLKSTDLVPSAEVGPDTKSIDESQAELFPDDVVDPDAVPSMYRLVKCNSGYRSKCFRDQMGGKVDELVCSATLESAIRQDGSGTLLNLKLIAESACGIWSWYLELLDQVQSAPSDAPGQTPSWTNSALFAAATLVSTSLECVGHISMVLGVGFKSMFRQVLYLLLELNVVPNSIVRSSARTTLLRLNGYCGYPDISNLYRDNIDYIVDQACASLRQSVMGINLLLRNRSQRGKDILHGNTYRSTARTHLVVNAVFDVIGADMFNGDGGDPDISSSWGFISAPITLMKDMILDALENMDTVVASGLSNGAEITAFLEVMRVLVERSRPVPLRSNADEYPSGRSAANCVALIEESLTNFKKSLRRLDYTTGIFESNEVPLDSETSKPTDQVEDEIKEESAEPNSAEKLILDVLERCYYFSASQNVRDQIIVMEIIRAGITRLSKNRRVLLPAIHKSWPALMNRIVQIRQVFISSCDAISTNQELIHINVAPTSRSPQMHTGSTYSRELLDDELPESPEDAARHRIGNLLLDDKRLSSTIAGKDGYNRDEIQFNRFLALKHNQPVASFVRQPGESVYGHLGENKSINNGANQSKSIQKLSLLPFLLDTILDMGALGNDFLSIKFQDNLWPELCLIQLHIFNIERKGLRPHLLFRKPSATGSPAKGGSREHENIPKVNPQPGKKKRSPLSLYEKSIISFLQFWVKILEQPAGQWFAGKFGGELAFLLIPLFGSHLNQEIQQATKIVVLALLQVPSCRTLVQAILQSVQGCCLLYPINNSPQLRTGSGDSSSTQSLSRQTDSSDLASAKAAWRAIVTHPAIVTTCTNEKYWKECENFKGDQRAVLGAASNTSRWLGGLSFSGTEKTVVSIPLADKLAESYGADDGLLEMVGSLLDVKIHTEPTAGETPLGSTKSFFDEVGHDTRWCQHMNHWQQI